jgi:hypothetical protein
MLLRRPIHGRDNISGVVGYGRQGRRNNFDD